MKSSLQRASGFKNPNHPEPNEAANRGIKSSLIPKTNPMRKGGELPWGYQHHCHWGSGRRKMEQFPASHVPVHWLVWPQVPVLLPSWCSSQPFVPLKAKIQRWLVLLCEGSSPGSSAFPSCPPSLGRETNNGSFHSHWGREGRQSRAGQQLPNLLCLCPAALGFSLI